YQIHLTPVGRVCHRRQRNRDAARRSRKKQTERADVLHEELQALEQSNAAFVKEIDDLKKELQHYHTVLKEHEPHCTVHCLSQPSL
uniref:Si:dkey-23i12.7 n=1 Tax=Astyanax mexicanus TaxID=7994 RepID=A0A8B9JPF7_ASTMX